MIRNDFTGWAGRSHRWFINHIAVLILFLITVGGCGRPGPNFLLVTLDTTRADRLGCYGYRIAHTPTLDSLASEGIRFDHAYSPVPLTLPAHATMLTGLQPWEHGVRDNGFYRLADSLNTLTESLRAHSYWCGAVIGAYPLIKQYGLARGFDVYDDGIPLSGKAAFYPERKAPEVTDRALQILQSRPRNRPAFFWIHYFDPHQPYEESFPGLSGYDAEIALMDRELGRLLSMLTSEETWNVIVVGDHGEGLWDHGEQTHGDKLYNSTLRVPLIICGPEWGGGRVRLEPVLLIDIKPTILTMIGKNRSISSGMPLLSRQNKIREIRAETVHPYLRYGWSPLRSIQRDSLKIIVGDRTEVYNIVSDPFETSNLVSNDRGFGALLSEKLPPVYEGGGVKELDPDERRALQALGYLENDNTIEFSEQRILALLDRGVELFGMTRFSEADSVFRLIIDQDPGNRKANLFVGLCTLKMGDYDEADRIFSALLERFPSYLPMKEGLAEVAFKKGEYDRSEILYEDILSIFPEHRDAILWLAVINRMQGEFESSLRYYEQYVGLVPDHAAVLKDMANLLSLHLDDPEGAEQYLERARAVEMSRSRRK